MTDELKNISNMKKQYSTHFFFSLAGWFSIIKASLQIGLPFNLKNNKLSITAILNPSVLRVELGGGWFLSKDVVSKLIYVDQNYKNFATYIESAGLHGMMPGAGISFYKNEK